MVMLDGRNMLGSLGDVSQYQMRGALGSPGIQQSRGGLWQADAQIAQATGMQDINASTETVYPCINGNSMNKKLEAAKKYLKNRG